MAEVGTIFETSIFEWKIPDIFSHTEERSSPTFSFSGCDWRLKVITEHERWIALSLVEQYSDFDITAAYNFGIKKADGTLEEYWKDGCTKTFNRNYSYASCFWDLRNFRERKTQLAPSDAVTFTLRVWDYKTTPTVSIQKASEFMELETLSSDFNDLFVGQKICDATLKVKDREFKVHRAVLAARSSVFSAMFENTMSEQETGVVDVPDCDPESFGEFLKYLYTGKLEGVSVRSAQHLYATADKYDVQQLKSFSVKYIQENMCVDDFCDVVALAELYDDDELMSSAKTFFKEKATEVVSTSEWEGLMGRNYRLANKMLKAAFNCKI